MSKIENKCTIYVYAHWEGMETPKLMGVLHSERLKGKEIFSFEYDKEWLKSGYIHLMDPNLQLYTGFQYPSNDKQNFGLFLDSSPDQWGRILMKRREAALARKEDRKENKLFETDYLLGVYDEYRMGALRFKLQMDGPFLNDNVDLSVPPGTSLMKLEEISLKLEEEDIVDDPEYLKWLGMLIAPGSSLGGARPKATIIDKDGSLWIAKFPSRNDHGNIGGWEMVAHELAKRAGVVMSESQAQKFSSNYYTFLTKRFDRNNKGQRIHFASAMTMLGYIDGQNHEDGASYLELAEFIMKNGANVEADLEQLWRRIVFNICISNTDDHLRNHGFILSKNGWLLSPAYDLNPVETGNGLSLNISEDDNSLDLELAMEVHKHFRLKEEKAKNIINDVKDVVKNWEKLATQYGISRTEQELKRSAFSNF